MLERLVDAIPPLKPPPGWPGRPRRRPAKLHADLGYASRGNRAALRRRGIASRIARRGSESRERLGRYRWVVERVRHEAPSNREEVRDLLQWAVAAAG